MAEEDSASSYTYLEEEITSKTHEDTTSKTLEDIPSKTQDEKCEEEAAALPDQTCCCISRTAKGSGFLRPSRHGFCLGALLRGKMLCHWWLAHSSTATCNQCRLGELARGRSGQVAEVDGRGSEAISGQQGHVGSCGQAQSVGLPTTGIFAASCHERRRRP